MDSPYVRNIRRRLEVYQQATNGTLIRPVSPAFRQYWPRAGWRSWAGRGRRFRVLSICDFGTRRRLRRGFIGAYFPCRIIGEFGLGLPPPLTQASGFTVTVSKANTLICNFQNL